MAAPVRLLTFRCCRYFFRRFSVFDYAMSVQLPRLVQLLAEQAERENVLVGLSSAGRRTGRDAGRAVLQLGRRGERQGWLLHPRSTQRLLLAAPLHLHSTQRLLLAAAPPTAHSGCCWLLHLRSTATHPKLSCPKQQQQSFAPGPYPACPLMRRLPRPAPAAVPWNS